MERKFNFSVDEYYHVYSRGVEKRPIFLERSDKERFVRSLFLNNSEKVFHFRETNGLLLKNLDRGQPHTAIGAYCLMPNHFHLLVRETVEGGISKFMSKLLTSHSMFFNTKYKRKGALFDGAFKARHVDSDNYLKYLFAYIHLNPVKLIESEWKKKGIQDKKIVADYLDNYKYSSYEDLTGGDSGREERLILSPESFPGYFDAPRDFNSFINDWLEYGDEEETPTVK